MSPTFGMHKLVYLASLTVLIDNYVGRKSEEKLDFLEKTAAWLTQNVMMLRQQANAKGTKRKKQIEEEEEKEDDVVSEVPRQSPTHQNQPVTKMIQGYDRQHNVSTPMQSQNRLPVATKQSVHQVRDASTATVTPTRQVLATHTDDLIQEETSRMQAPVATKQSVHQVREASTATVTPTRQVLATHTDDLIQEETSRMQAPDQDQDILAQAVMQGNIPMTADASEMLSEDGLSSSSLNFVGLYGVASKWRCTVRKE